MVYEGKSSQCVRIHICHGMKENHLNVSESISVMEDLGAELMIPGHWGTFKLGDEPPGLPKYQYEKLNNKRVRLMKVGEVFPLEKK